MSDNDQIMRRAVLKLEFRPSECYMDEDGKVYVSWESLIKEVSTIPAVPQEMSAREFFEIMKRRAIAEKRNAEIIFTPSMLTLGDFDAWIADAEQWAADHPEKRKTYAEDFLQKYPNAAWNKEENRPFVCREDLYNAMEPKCLSDCAACWNEEMEDKDECGEWIQVPANELEISRGYIFVNKCSKCGHRYIPENDNFCPNCGKDMRKEVNDD